MMTHQREAFIKANRTCVPASFRSGPFWGNIPGDLTHVWRRTLANLRLEPATLIFCSYFPALPALLLRFVATFSARLLFRSRSKFPGLGTRHTHNYQRYLSPAHRTLPSALPHKQKKFKKTPPHAVSKKNR
jgi:hypothetical protein